MKLMPYFKMNTNLPRINYLCTGPTLFVTFVTWCASVVGFTILLLQGTPELVFNKQTVQFVFESMSMF